MDQKTQWAQLGAAIGAALADLAACPQNVPDIAARLLHHNVSRGRGLLCREVVAAARRGQPPLAACGALISVVNSQVPAVGLVLVARLAAEFKASKHNTDGGREVGGAAAAREQGFLLDFMCALALYGVADHVLLLQLLQMLLGENPAEADILQACKVVRHAGGTLAREARAALDTVFDRLRVLLQSGAVSRKCQVQITHAMRDRRDGLADRLLIDPALDVVPPEDKETHFVDLARPGDPAYHLDAFQEDPDFERNEQLYREARQASVPAEEAAEAAAAPPAREHTDPVTDMTDSKLLQTQKKIYLTIMSSMSADEAVHKLEKLRRADALEHAVVADMVIKCCAQEKTYSKYFGVMGESMCRLHASWAAAFAEQFRDKYDTMFQYEGAQLRNIGKFFGHLLAADVLPLPATLGHVHLTESTTTSAGRVFIKFLFQEMVEELGIGETRALLEDDFHRDALRGLLPVSNVTTADLDHIMFSINYFTAIGLGVLTEQMRDVMKTLPEERRGRKRARGSDSGSSRSGSSRSGSYSRSRSGSYSRSRSGSYSRSRSGSYSRSRSASYSRSPSRSRSHSRTPSR